MRNVVVTGLSAVSALGLDYESTWDAVCRGIPGVREISRFDAGDLPCRVAAQLPEGAVETAKKAVKPRTRRQMTPITLVSVAAGVRAFENAGLGDNGLVADRTGVAFGATGTGYALDEQALDRDRPHSFRILKNMPSAAPAFLAILLNARGPGFTASTACSSSALAVAQAADIIRHDRADVMIAGGGDASVTPEDVAAFAEILALSTRDCPPEEASCPFDRRRDGFVIGEGAAFLVLEEAGRARRRGAKIFAELAGSATLTEGYNILSPEKGGEGMARTLAAALRDARVDPGEIDYINAHGTSTPLNDPLETRAIRKVLGSRAPKVPVSSTKSMLGHTLAAAGALESVITVLALRQGLVPPTANLRQPDPECDLDYVPGEAREIPLRAAVTHSFAFGGHNTVLVFRRT
jgi:3-oxoacyl-[acyl-carrier-protein] synthase II